jgi:carbonic anhydrase
MADLHTLIDGNLEFARGFSPGDLAMRPRPSTLVLTCLDARVDPAHFLGLELGDAFVMRNVGGRVTDEVIQQIAILRALAVVLGGGGALEVAIIHHTDCGTGHFADPQVRKTVGQAAGTGEAAIERLAVTDARTSVAEDLDRLRAAPILPDELLVAGYVYDVTDGLLREISAPAPLRE